MTFWGPKDLVRSISLDPTPASRTACLMGQGQPHSIAVAVLGGHSTVITFRYTGVHSAIGTHLQIKCLLPR